MNGSPRPLHKPDAAPVALQIDAVSFRYPNGREALCGLDLSLTAGILGLLGPNGAGKSTLMRVLATLAKPTQGCVRWKGIDIAQSPDVLREELGYLPQDFGVYHALSAREFLGFLAAVKGVPARKAAARVDECLMLVGLTDVATRRLGEFSGGMRQRVGIAQALLNDPRLLIVDEPTVGLDPEERLRFRHLLTDLSGDRLVILSTHIVSDLEASATSLAVLLSGHLRFTGTPDQMLEQARGKVWECMVAPDRLAELRAQHSVSSSLRRPEGIRARVLAAEAPLPDAQPVAPELEDAYMWLLSQAQRAA